MNGNSNKYFNYKFHPNYKKTPIGSFDIINGKNILNYEKYLENIELPNNQINTLFFDFNNSARLYKPNKLDKVTRVINNTDININNYLNKIKSMYKSNNNQLNNLLLVNAWNKWGEKMHLEPSEQKGFYYLEKIKNLSNL